MTYDVLICGYGPAGGVAANLLGQCGLRVLVVERNRGIYEVPRAVHFDGEVMRIFQSLGLAAEAERFSAPVRGMRFVNGRGRVLLAADIGADFRPRHAWPFGLFFNQPQLEAALREGAARFPSVETRLGWEMLGFEQDDALVRVRIRRADGSGEAEEVAARFLLGCDGASSPTRERAGIALDDRRCDEPWLVCDVLVEDGIDYDRTLYQICDRRRPTTLVPCEGRHLRWEFMLRPGDDPEALEREDSVRRLMAPHLHRLAPGLRPEQTKLLRHKTYTFHALVARRWRDRRVFLLGDAAHQMPPFLGQGLCSGVRDAHNLCWKLEGVLRGRFRPEVLDSYESERAPHARAAVEQAIRVGRVIQATHPLTAALRDAYFAMARALPVLTRPFLWEPCWPLGPGLFGPASAPGASTAHGNPFDQFWVEAAGGGRQRLDALLGRGFAVVGIGVDPRAGLTPAAREVLATLDARFVSLETEGAPWPEAEARDADGGLRAWLDRVGEGRIALLRPERQVYGLFDGPGDLGAATGSLGRELLAA